MIQGWLIKMTPEMGAKTKEKVIDLLFFVKKSLQMEGFLHR
ncbi:hypothetical protein P872_00970 [Rhodonellum psychrophilum GCM71 = DSM 17998]|uniref:Uncharacterized protein n=1 Tax=Rhodonellum psychrophilum GCM71 = DSM 17998 TaxID=1123057 RepID=U5C212_9BACT|nr:hypothetical protein P872_00970 [Rhodonellum psychrophilum GCM71 = DSM 17998]